MDAALFLGIAVGFGGMQAYVTESKRDNGLALGSVENRLDARDERSDKRANEFSRRLSANEQALNEVLRLRK